MFVPKTLPHVKVPKFKKALWPLAPVISRVSANVFQVNAACENLTTG